MRSLVAIRTNRWTEEEERLLESLKAAGLTDIVVVFHNRPKEVSPPVPVVDLDDAWVEKNDLRITSDWGWRCGDYFYYTLRQAHPDYDFYWLIEPDVFFTEPPVSFFDVCSGVSDDVLGVNPGPFDERIPFARGLKGVPIHRAIFALTRLSGRALDRLFAARRDYCASWRRERVHTNDEIFVFSTAAADPDLSVGNLVEIVPNWFDGVQFATNPDLIWEAVPEHFESGRVFHPVRSHLAYRQALAQRLTTWPGFMSRSQASLAHLTDEDIEDIAVLTAERMKAMLIAARG